LSERTERKEAEEWQSVEGAWMHCKAIGEAEGFISNIAAGFSTHPLRPLWVSCVLQLRETQRMGHHTDFADLFLKGKNYVDSIVSIGYDHTHSDEAFYHQGG
jgi:hypothetical protein